MKKEIELKKSVISCVLIVALMVCCPLESVAQSMNNRSNLLEGGTSLVLRLNETFKTDNTAENGVIPSVVESDVYSADGSRVLVKAGTPAFIEYTAEKNGSWGKAGQICVTYATTKTIDNKNVSLRLSSCKKGGSKLAGVIVLSVLLCPLGLFSGFMKGSMPKLQQGTTFNANVMQDVSVE